MDQKNIEKVVLFSPLFLAFVWLTSLTLTSGNLDPNLALGPSRIDALVNLLFAFILLYSIVLIFVFIKMNKKIALKPVKRKKKRK